MTCRTTAIANRKGGVGKTTLTTCLAESLCHLDPTSRILVIDIDPQASASVSLLGDDRLVEVSQTGRTIDAYLERHLTGQISPDARPRLSELIVRDASTTLTRGSKMNIALLPCGTDLGWVEKEAIKSFMRQKRGPDAYEMRLNLLLEHEMADITRDFDHIVIDSSPSSSTLNEIMIRKADMVLLPTIPDFISIYGLMAFIHSAWRSPIAGLPLPGGLPHVVVSRHQPIVQHRKNIARMRKTSELDEPPFRMLRSMIPQSVAFPAALSMGTEIMDFEAKYTSKIVKDVILPLANEIRSLHR